MTRLKIKPSVTSIAYFGARWSDASRHFHIPTPVGHPCYECLHPIVEGDQGTRVRFIACATLGIVPQYTHRECMFLAVYGHTVGTCECNNYSNVGNKRAAAILFWALHAAGHGLTL